MPRSCTADAFIVADAPLFATLYTARALRRFKPDPIPEEVLFQLFDAAIRAPSGQNAQDWRFVVVRDAAVKRQMQQWSQAPWHRYIARYADDPPRSTRCRGHNGCRCAASSTSFIISRNARP